MSSIKYVLCVEIRNFQHFLDGKNDILSGTMPLEFIFHRGDSIAKFFSSFTCCSYFSLFVSV